MTRTPLFVLLALGLFGCDPKDRTPDSKGLDDSGCEDADGDGDCEDCDDTDPLISHYAAELCDGIDNDCDGDIDDDDSNLAGGTTTWYIDQDGDDYGSVDEEYEACEPPYSNAVEAGGDCDDDDSTVNPGEAEVCDGVDNDCSVDIDDNPIDGLAVYADSDGDSFGDPDAGGLRCETGDGWSEDGTDCDDADFDVNPGAEEICFNDIDDNCDEAIDDTCPNEHCGDITTDETWEATPYGHYVSCDISVEGATAPILTIEGGTTVYFAEGVGLYVGSGDEGALVVSGSGDNMVEFTSGLPITSPDEGLRPGLWTGLVLGPYTDTDELSIVGLDLRYAGMEHALGGYTDLAGLLVSATTANIEQSNLCANGGSGVVAADGAMVAMSDVVLCENDEHGFYADDTSGLDGASPAMSSTDFSDNGDYPVSIRFSYAGELENTLSFASHSSDAAYIELRGDTVSSSITVQAQDYPFYVSGDVDVWGSGTPKVTLNDGVSMYFSNDVGLTIGTSRGGGSLTVDGSSDGVLMTEFVAGNGWDGLTVSTGADTVILDGLTLEHGGDNGFGNLYIENGSGGVSVDVSNSAITDASGYGVYVGVDAAPGFVNTSITDNASSGIYVLDTSTGEGGLSEFSCTTEKAVTGNGGYPIELPAASLGALDGDCTYEGNGTDRIYVTESTVTEDATWEKLDVDYYVSGVIDIEGSSGPVVEIEAGARFEMEPATGVNVGDGANGALSTNGTAADLVTFTSADSSPAAGDWDGILFGSSTIASSSVLNGLEVLYAGSSRTGAVEIKRVSPSFSDCHVAYSSYDGVYVSGTTSVTTEPEFSGCTIEDNDGSGFAIDADAGIGDFDSNTIINNDGYAVEIEAAYVSSLDTASTYTPNGEEGVYVTDGLLSGSSVSVTWSDIGVPFILADDLEVKSSASLTLKAGTELRFMSAKAFLAATASSGSLTINGTGSNPVVLTSAQTSPAAGDWAGFSLGSYCKSASITGLDVTYGTTNFTVNCGLTMTISNSSFLESSSYDVNCGSKADYITWTSIDYDTQTGCTGL